MNNLKIIIAFFTFHLAFSYSAFADVKVSQDTILQTLEKLLATPEEQINLARAKLTIDKLIDPSINVQVSLNRINRMARTVDAMAGQGANQQQKLFALKKYIYEKGAWNNNKPFQYNMKDPLGTYIPSKLLTNYLQNRLGNCVSMPF